MNLADLRCLQIDDIVSVETEVRHYVQKPLKLSFWDMFLREHNAVVQTPEALALHTHSFWVYLCKKTCKLCLHPIIQSLQPIEHLCYWWGHYGVDILPEFLIGLYTSVGYSLRNRKLPGPQMVTTVTYAGWAPCQCLYCWSIVAQRKTWRANPQPLADSISPLVSSPGETYCGFLIGERGAQIGSWWEMPQTEERVRKASCIQRHQQNETDGADPPWEIVMYQPLRPTDPSQQRSPD